MNSSELISIFFIDITSNSKKFVESGMIGKQRSMQDKDVLVNLETLKHCDIEKHNVAWALHLIHVHILFSISSFNKTLFVFIDSIHFSLSVILISVNLNEIKNDE